MHTEMWEHPAVEENIKVLHERGVVIVPPEEGRLAGGDIGKGRLADPASVVDAVVALFADGPLSGRSVLISAGGTREPIDPVRYIGNRSSGKQGHALAEEAAALGADVTLVTSAPLPSSPRITRVDVSTAHEMFDAVTAVSNDMDVVVMAAAVADFRPVGVSTQKIKKADGPPSVLLEQTVDILAQLGKQKPAGQVLVGFAAETNNVKENALGKLKRKGADLLVANDVSAPGVGFAHDTNAVTIFGSDGSVRDIPLTDKTAIARAVLDAATERLPTTES
jgi:phosphopantothenoylcysteine decarboxylase/phosphopantothenate--cysteine ligase